MDIVPLLSEGYDTSLPRHIVSQQNYDRLLHRLMDAKARGSITDFEPDFFGGFVRITNPSISLRGGSGNFPVKTNMREAIVKPTTAEGKTADRSLGFQVSISENSSCFVIQNAGDGTLVVGLLKTASGELIGMSEDYASSTGYLFDCFWVTNPIKPGDKVIFKLYDSGSNLLGTYISTIPRNTFLTINKSAGIVTGRAPAGLTFKATWYHDKQDAGNTHEYQEILGTVAGSGNWSADFIKPFRGSDILTLYLYKGEHFTFDYHFKVPRLDCGIRSNNLSLTGIPNTPVTVTITQGAKIYTYSGLIGRSGYFYVYLYDSLGDPIPLASGNKITGTGASTFILPSLQMTVNRTDDTVTGTAPASKYFSVYIQVVRSYVSEIKWTSFQLSW